MFEPTNHWRAPQDYNRGTALREHITWDDAHKWHATQIATVAIELHAITARTIDDPEWMLDDLWEVCDAMEAASGPRVDDFMRRNIWKQFYRYADRVDVHSL